MDKKKEKLIGAAGWWVCGVGLIIAALIGIIGGKTFFEDIGLWYNWFMFIAGIGLIVAGFFYFGSDDFREKMDGEAERMHPIDLARGLRAIFRIFRR